MADQTEENTHQKEDDGAIKPGAELEEASYGVTDHDVAQERDPGETGAVPPYLVCTLGSKAREDKNEEYIK